jgi:hypothetical protein
MRTAILSVLLLSAGLVLAQEQENSAIEVPEDVIDELGMIEEINVTAEKPPIDDNEAIDADIEAILGEADELDADSE